MDGERDKLVAALRRKLTELDALVVAYRHERANEFRQYAVELLRPVAMGTVSEVAKSLDGATSSTAEDFPALYPGFLDAGDKSILSPPTPMRAQSRRTVSPPPVLYHTSGVPKEGPRRPLSPSRHGRDDEFRGVFTPPFLPLLDSSSDDRRSSGIEGVYSTPPAAEQSSASADRDAAMAATAKAAAAVEAADAADAAASEKAAEAAALAAIPPPEPKLKSALRRSLSISSSRSSTSSNNRPTPSNTRHVRFSFGGEEVLPTSSPPSEYEQDLSWLLHDDRGGFNSQMDEFDDMEYQDADMQALSTDHRPSKLSDEAANSDEDSSPDPYLALPGAPDSVDSQPHSHGPGARGWVPGDREKDKSQGDESQPSAQGDSTAPSHTPAFTATSSPEQRRNPPRPPQPRRRHSQILDDDDQDFAPLARKASSSDRLRALSKMPLEDPSMWTVVNPQPQQGLVESDASLTPSVNEIISTHSQINQQQQRQIPRQSSPSSISVEQIECAGSEYDNTDNNGNSISDGSDSDEDNGFIAMRSSRKMPTATAEAAATTSESATRSTPPITNGLMPEESSSSNDSALPKKSTSSGKAVQVQVVDSAPVNTSTAPTAGEDDDFFDFEGDDDVGYPLSRSSDVNTRFEEEEESKEDEAEDNTGSYSVAEAESNIKEPRVNDADLVEKEKAALGIGTDDLDSSKLVFNHRKALGASPSSSTPPGLPTNASVGSYRGRPIDLFNVVKDPRVLQEAAQLGELDSFVGSIHDGHQPSTMADFSSLSGPERLNLLSGTPRSLTERMAMDEARILFSPSSKH